MFRLLVDAKCLCSVLDITAVIDEVLVTAEDVLLSELVLEPLFVGATIFLALSLISEAATSRANSPVGTLEGVVEVEVDEDCKRVIGGATVVEDTRVGVTREVGSVTGVVCVVSVEDA